MKFRANEARELHRVGTAHTLTSAAQNQTPEAQTLTPEAQTLTPEAQTLAPDAQSLTQKLTRCDPCRLEPPRLHSSTQLPRLTTCPRMPRNLTPAIERPTPAGGARGGVQMLTPTSIDNCWHGFALFEAAFSVKAPPCHSTVSLVQTCQR